MNRILVDEIGNKVSDDTFNLLIKEDTNLYISSNAKNYIINIYNSKVNILGILEDIDELNFEINLYSSDVTFNLATKNVNNCLVKSFLYEENSIFNMYNTVYAKEKIKMNIETFHKCNNTESYIYNCGVTMKNGGICFDVISKVSKEYNGCVLNQNSKIISLNSVNDNKINPILLIDNYNTKASHSAFIGKFNDDEVFYLQCKGIKKSDAYKLLLDGFLIGIMEIDDKEKDKLKEKINNVWR